MRLIEARKLTLGYEGQAVVKDIDFTLDEGDYLCVVGDNGAGKSTLVKAILGLIRPMAGQLDFHVPSGSIGYMPQSMQGDRNFPTSVWEVALSGAVNKLGHHFFHGAQARSRTRDNLERMGMWEMRKRSFQELSGGQRQRVLLARALVAAQSILLVDEPVAGLDIHSASELYALIDSLNREGMTIMMVTHDIHPALNSASHILHLGHECFFGPKADYFASRIGQRYLEEAGHHD